MAIKPKAKQAYLKYDQIQAYIDSGKLDQYDFIYATDRHTWNIIDKDLNIVPIQSRIICFESESEAIEYINSNADSYPGKIINIYETDKYVPYIINLDAETEKYYVSPVSTISDDHDYNNLFNKPIENIIANEEIILSELEDGIYTLKGMYRICEQDETHRILTTKETFIKETISENDREIIYISEFNSKSINRYICTENDFIEDRYILLSELNSIIERIIDTDIPQKIDEYIEGHLASENDIRNLFN